MPTPLAPDLPWFNEWLKRTGEACPDFDAMPSCADLPPLLTFADGRAVRSPADWAARQREILGQLRHWFWGTFPVTPPTLVAHRILTEEREHYAIRRRVELTFDARSTSIRFIIDLLIPDGDGPFPVFLTQSTHRGWSAVGVSRGYLCCTYPACDGDDASLLFAPLCPECDWTTIPRRAWLTGRVLDYVLTLPQADRRHVGVTGHSRNGKLALIAAAIEPRITNVIASSAGAGGASPYRFTSEREFAESLDCTTWMCPDWFHPRLRFFVGREHKLPIDTHAYLAIIAPRPCLISSAFNDACESIFAVERGVEAGRPAYAFTGRSENLRLLWRPGGHETSTQLIQTYFDWFDHHAGRAKYDFSDTTYFHFDWQEWRRDNAVATPPRPTAGAARDERRRVIQWSLGEEPPAVPHWGDCYGKDAPHVSVMLDRNDPPPSAKRVGVQFSDYVAGDLYLPADAKGPVPVVIWLHPYSQAQGYRGSYIYEPGSWKPYKIYDALTRAGYACLAFDQLGHGTRQHEGSGFYKRYPRWSRLGRMVRDVRGAVDFLRAGEGRVNPLVSDRWKPDLSRIDTGRIFVSGYSLGGMVGLYSAALDERIAGVASFCGFTPMRSDTDAKPTGGLRRFWEWYGLQPRLGEFHNREQDLPFDFDDVLACVAPRPTLIVSPLHDRDADAGDVTRCVEVAQNHWPNRSTLTYRTPDDYSRFQATQHDETVEWLRRVAPL
ncbi:MAG: alpha/beta fold hydrolase [Planctomycetes bacterium]|nr:alpha/beta fold hydrolase [Planctomycetota bacterium]